MEFLHPSMWHDHDIDFVRWLHPAMGHVALESWQWVHQVAAPCNVAGGSGMTCHWVCPNVRHIGNSHLVSISTTSPQSTCHSAPVSEIFIQIEPPSPEKNDVMSISRWRISAIFGFMGPITGPLKSPDTTSYRSSVVFEKMAFLHFGERQTNKQTNRWTAPMH